VLPWILLTTAALLGLLAAEHNRLWGLPLYYAAQLCLAASVRWIGFPPGNRK
jgi:hypothetical protein